MTSEITNIPCQVCDKPIPDYVFEKDKTAYLCSKACKAIFMTIWGKEEKKIYFPKCHSTIYLKPKSKGVNLFNKVIKEK